MIIESINVASICASTNSLGPGNRFALWVQGCPFKCKKCIAPQWIPFKIANIIKIDALAKTIIDNQKISGITISGGEPMMQARQISNLLRKIKKYRPELNTIIFTGFTKKQLVWDEAQNLLSLTDLLIDGQYVDHKNDNIGLRGSSNQKFHFLTDRLLSYKEEILKNRPNIEFHVLDDGVLMTGLPSTNFKW